MKIIILRRLPMPRSFIALNLFGVVFSRQKLTPEWQNHEYIHTLQQCEMLYLFFYLWYAVEWLLKLILYRNATKAYFQISFEREAYHNQKNLDYKNHRKHYAWWKYRKNS